MKVSYAPTRFEAFGEEEIEAVTDCLRKGWLGVGELVSEFEEQVAKRFGKKFGVMVNSGSSANLLAAEEIPSAATVATPVLTFATTLAYLLKDMRIHLVDIEEGTYQTDFGLLTEHVDVLFVPNLIGNIPHWTQAPPEAFVVEDSCDTIPDARPPRADLVTTSFYASHVITACGGGGMVMSEEESAVTRFRSKRAWGRPLVEETDLDARWGDVDGIGYDRKYTYVEIGYNFQPIEVQAAFGLVQLSKLDSFLSIRRKNFERLQSFFEQYEELFILPRTREGANWLAFPLTIRERIERLDFVRFLEEKGIQTRPIFSGNITRQPAYAQALGKRSFPVADKVMRDGVLLGSHHGLTDDHLSYLEDTVGTYLSRL